jgi:hypothetical protein
MNIRLPGTQRGQILPLVGIAALVLVGITGFAADAGYHQYQQRMQQTATDSAALAGAQELLVGDWRTAGQKDASTNGYTDNTGAGSCPNTPAVGTICVELYNPPQAGDAYASNSKAVEADITVYHPTFFESVFNINNVPVTTKAVAVLTPQASPACMYVLSGNANFNAGQNGGTLNAANCGLVLNGGANFNGTTVNAGSISCAATCSNGTFTGAQPVTTAPAGDPCGLISYCAYMAGTPPSTSCASTVTASNNQDITVNPGCYSSMDLHKANSITFNCGLYVLTGTLNASANGKNQSPINISQPSCGTGGVTFYITGGGSIQFKNVNMNLSAPSSGDYGQYSSGEQNVLFYQDPGDSSTPLFQSAVCQTCSTTLNGMMYFPSANLNYNQGSSVNTGSVLIIAGTLNYNGSTTNIFNVPTNNSTIVDIAVLGE